MKLNGYFVLAAVIGGMVCSASAKAGGQLGELYLINSGTEAKIQAHVLNSMLGPGKAFVFLEMKAEVKSTSDEESKGGVGEVHTTSPERSVENEAAAMGKEEAKKNGKDKKTASEQSARQVKKSAEKKVVFKFKVESMKARILHSAAVSPEKLKAVKEALLALYPENIKAEDIVFVPAVFDSAPAAEAAYGQGQEDDDE
ncbi:MAG: hypothetical protein Q7R35_06570 [Elusimicrobiota bacterium]|nr:hypothetical protein [Elusimicrobiota bacterium]